jgi:hypothetical protein
MMQLEKKEGNIFFEEFKMLLKNAIVEDYKSLQRFSNKEKPYACALVTDSDASTIFFAMNTIEKLNDKLLNVDEKYKAYYKWTPCEWAYGDDDLSDEKMISKASGILSKKTDEKEVKENFPAFETGLYECMTTVLKELNDEKCFLEMVVFISISDDKRARSVENYSAKLINSESVSNDFVKRFDKIEPSTLI